MEAETGRASSHHQGLQLTLPSPGISGLDVVRALHQTVISLRSALDSSREELRRLKESVGEFSEEKYVEVVERLALENHVLRRKILSRSTDFSNDASTSPRPTPPPPPPPQPPPTQLPPPPQQQPQSQQSRFVPLQIEEGDPTEASSSSLSADTASATMEASGNKVVVVEETAETIRTSGSRRSTGGSSPETEARGISVFRRVRRDFPSLSTETPFEQEDNRQDRQRQQHTSEDGALSRCILPSLNETVTGAVVSVFSEENKEEDVREDIQDDDVQDDNEGSVVVDRLDIPEKDSEDLSLRSVSDGDNSVFSDNPEPQSPPQQRPIQQAQQRQHQHQHQQQQQQHRQQSQSGEQGKLNDQSENDSEELDDIELIFTTDDTCRDLGLQEDLVSITETDAWQQPSPAGQPVLLKYTKSAEGESLVCNGDKTSSVEEAVSSQSSSIDREESVDRFDESSSTRLNKMWSQCSVLVETDISKCGVLEEPEHSTRHATRRNTLAAPPTAYRPIIHREALAVNRRKNSAPLRPVMDRSGGAKRESGAQTDISALPAQWRSESYLAHKVAHTFTTLPSKFALPAGVPGRLRLSDKTREARRVLLSDISFTSMVPELSRSADHLCHDPHAQTCLGSRGCGHRTPEVNRRESLGSPAGGYWPRCNPGTALPSPCDCRLSADLYSSRYRGSLSSIPSPGLEVVSGPPRRHSWRATAASFDTWRVPVATSTPRPTWSSMPSSPTHVHPPATSSRSSKNVPKRTRSKVTFQECPMTRGSLPNLRSDIVGAGDNSGDSTESLIDEAEDYLRRSIDSMLTISSTSAGTDYWNNRQTAARRRRTRRHSEPDLAREWIPPQDARPYLPKIPRDLKLDHLVKVISPEGRVLQGRVRYVGPVPGREDSHVGVELPNVNGSSDGTFHGRRFFDCEPDRAIFVPFKKVVLAWCTA